MAEKATGKDGDVLLVPVDFSPHSEAAMVFAAELAQSMGACLTILHVVHDPGEMPGYYSKMVKKKRLVRLQDVATEMFDDFVKKVRAKHPGKKALKHAELMVVVGLPLTRILEVVDRVHPRMVVMGSQGRTGLAHLLLGSKAEQVVKLCKIPVTIVKGSGRN